MGGDGPALPLRAGVTGARLDGASQRVEGVTRAGAGGGTGRGVRADPGDDSYREAATAPLSAHDRTGRRLGAVYLGRMPEPGQGALSEQLTRLITDVLKQWTGPLPRL